MEERNTKEESRIAALSIIVEDGERTEELNHIIHEYADYIVGRMGIPYRQKGISIISLVMDAPQDVISTFSGRIGRIQGITAKAAYAKLPARHEIRKG